MKLGPFLILACLQVFAQNNFQTFEAGNFIGLKDNNGDVIVQPIYDNIGWSNSEKNSSNEIIGYKRGLKWGLMSISGKELTPSIYDKIEPLFSGLFKVAIKGKFTNRFFYGAIDENGKIKLNLDYFELVESNGILIATKLDSRNFLKGALNQNLTWITPVHYKHIRKKNDLVIGQLPNGQFDIYHSNGTKLVSELDEIEEKRSFLITSRRGKTGKISWDGAEVMSPENKLVHLDGSAQPFPNWIVDPTGEDFNVRGDSLTRWNQRWLVHRNNFFQVYSGGNAVSTEYQLISIGKFNIIGRTNGDSEWVGLDLSGEVVLRSSDSIKSEGNFLLKKKRSSWTVHDRFGQKISSKSFDQVIAKNNRFLAVKKHGYWALLDGVKKEVSSFRYDEIGIIQGSTAVVKYIDHWGVFLDGKGWIIPPDYDEISPWNDFFLARKKSGFYLFDGAGLIRFQTIDKLIPTEEYLLVSQNNRFSAIGKRGIPLTNTEFRAVSKWGDYFELQNEFAELYESNGRRILSQNDQIQNISGFTEGLFLVMKNDNFGFVDIDGKLRIANRYESAKVFAEGLAPIKLREKWGFINQSENLIIQPYYQDVSGFRNGICLYQLNNLFGFLDQSGREVSGPLYDSIYLTDHGNYILKGVNGKYGFANHEGQLSLTPSYDKIEDMGSDKLRTTRNGKIGLLNYSGRETLGFTYDDLRLIDGKILLKTN